MEQYDPAVEPALQLEANVAIIPNIPDARTPVGKDDSENVVLRTVGQLPEYDFEPKIHWDLGPALGILDFERGVKITGSRFYVLKAAGARLQRALIAWMLDLHTRQGYAEVYTPFLVRSEILYAAAPLPKFRDNLYNDAEEDQWMVPTAEVPITGLHKDEILEAADLPRGYKAMAQLSYELKDNAKAIEYGKKSLELDPGSADTAMIVAHAMYLSDDLRVPGRSWTRSLPPPQPSPTSSCCSSACSATTSSQLEETAARHASQLTALQEKITLLNKQLLEKQELLTVMASEHEHDKNEFLYQTELLRKEKTDLDIEIKRLIERNVEQGENLTGSISLLDVIQKERARFEEDLARATEHINELVLERDRLVSLSPKKSSHCQPQEQR